MMAAEFSSMKNTKPMMPSWATVVRVTDVRRFPSRVPGACSTFEMVLLVRASAAAFDGRQSRQSLLDGNVERQIGLGGSESSCSVCCKDGRRGPPVGLERASAFPDVRFVLRPEQLHRGEDRGGSG